MPVSDALKHLRQDSYGESSSEEKKESPGSRVLTLSEEEGKALVAYGKPGEEITCTVHGKLEGDHFHVMSVEAPQGPPPEVEAMMNDRMAGSVPMTT